MKKCKILIFLNINAHELHEKNVKQFHSFHLNSDKKKKRPAKYVIDFLKCQ